MGQKLAYEASSPKNGMTLAELKKAVDQAEGLAKINEKLPEDCNLAVLINFRGGIKQIVVEV